MRTMEKEYEMLQECLIRPPSSVTGRWLNDLTNRIGEYDLIMRDFKASEKQYIDIIDGIVKGLEVPVGTAIVKALHELYNKEREKKQVENKYQYYPRLKKAKEASLYVFSNKVKIIMESEYVKVA